MPEEFEEIEPEVQQEQTPLARAEEAENTAEIAIGLADEANAQIAQLQTDIVALNERINAIESELSNVRTNAGNVDERPIDISPEETRSPSEEPSIIKPRREHPYYRKLW